MFLPACFVLAVTLPLLSSLFSFVTPGRYAWLTILNAPLLLMLAAVSSVLVLLTCWGNPDDIVTIPWLNLGDSDISANVYLSDKSILMMAVVIVISFLVHLYSVGYMAGDGGVRKYFGMLGLFTFAMLGIVLSDNLLVLFVFWELVGFSSYVLIGHSNEKSDAARAATKAFLMNRVGDIAFLVGLMIIWSMQSTFEIIQLQNANLFDWQTAAGLCIFCGVIGKSAQFPLFTWLPDAMEGPTPVSALIHAATMVAAGVYLLIRIFPLFTETALACIAVTGAVTAIIGSSSALFQRDIKKVLAYSTISQLGLMVLTIGMGGVGAAFLHLITHAFFKAGLFLCAGLVIHALHHAQAREHIAFDVQDLRNLGGLRKKLPITFTAFLICGASLAGIPFFSGFISKEAMYTAILTDTTNLSIVMFAVIAVTSFLTVLYTFRLIFLIFMGSSRHNITTIQESPSIMRFPVIVLSLLSLWLLVGWNPVDFNGWLVVANQENKISWLLPFSLLLIIVSLIAAISFFKTGAIKHHSIFERGLNLDQLYRATFVNFTLRLSSAVQFTDTKVVDGALHVSAYGHVMLAHFVGWFDKFFIDGSVSVFTGFIRWVGGIIRSYQNGKVQDYILWAIIALIIFIIWTL